MHKPLDPLDSAGTPRVLHCIGEFDAHEAMGRTVLELARLVPGEHHLYAGKIRATDGFASCHEAGGSTISYLHGPTTDLRSTLARVNPDIVHFHGGAFAALYAPFAGGRPTIVSIYHWARLPELAAMRRVGIRALRNSQVLQARTIATSLLPGIAVRAALQIGSCAVVITGDQEAAYILAKGSTPVAYIPSGAALGTLRAQYAEHATIVFCGRAETIRGITVLIDAMEQIVRRRPGTRCRLALLDRPELPAILRQIAASGVADSIDVTTEPVDNLPELLAACQVGVFPFLVDHVTLPPAYTITEALAVGLPIVASTTNNVIGIVDSTNGVLVTPGSAEDLAQGILDILEQPNRWQTLSHGALCTAERHDFNHLARTVAAAYRTAVETCPAARSGTGQNNHDTRWDTDSMDTDSMDTDSMDTDIRDEFRTKFDQWAPHYSDDAFVGAGMAAVSNGELATLDKLALGGAAVLDVGVGTGRIAQALIERGATVVGMDQAPGMLAATAGTLGGRLSLVQARLGDPLPFADATFDAITCFRVIKYVPNTEAVLAEFARCLRPGGRMLVEFSNRQSLARWGYAEPVHLSTPTEVATAAQHAGLVVVDITGGTHLPHPVWRWAKSAAQLRAVTTTDTLIRRILALRGARSFTLLAERP